MPSSRELLIIGVALSTACSTAALKPPVRKDPTPAIASTASPKSAPGAATNAAPDAAVHEAPPIVPAFTVEPFAPAGSALRSLFAIEGGLVVAEEQRVGRLEGDRIEWIGKIPKGDPAFGQTTVLAVHGRLPDNVGATYATGLGRVPMPTYIALTGKAAQHTEAGGGGWGAIFPARINDSTVLAAASGADGYRILTVRGPKVARRFAPAKGRCKPDEMLGTFGPDDVNPAVVPSVFESTQAGTLVSLGTLCQKRGPAAEIWDKTTGASSIVDLGAWWSGADSASALLKGAGDELWAFADEFHPVLHFAGGKFEALPVLDSPTQNVFVSPSGQLHAYTSSGTFWRFEAGAWTPFARFVTPPSHGFSTFALAADGALWSQVDNKVVRLRETTRIPAEDVCKNWFVYLYMASSSNAPGYTYPATRKALSTFPEIADVGLVEYGRSPRHLGITTTSKAQAHAVAAHIQATMKDEHPKVFCFVPENTRRIADEKRK